MKNKKYIVCRDDIYVGEVAQQWRNRIFRREEGNSKFEISRPSQLSVNSTVSYGSMLFVPNQDKLCDDLLYDSPNYPILNVTDDDICLNLDMDRIFINRACNLGPLLEYFGYKKDLTYEDVINIRKIFFTGRFAKDNCELFGYRELMAEECEFYYSNGQKVTDSMEIERRRKQYKAEQQSGYFRLFYFYDDDEFPLPREYFHILDEMGDDDEAVNAIGEKVDVFARQEGPIKKLSIF